MPRMRGCRLSVRYALSPSGPAVIITDAVLATMDHFRQTRPRDKEAGGQLFAQFDGVDTIIIEATPPKILDRRTRYTFKPNRWLQQREISERHRRGYHFVGDWHTHPEPIPHPSQDDIRNMRECFCCSRHDLRAFIMVIVGTMPVPEGLYVALIERNAVRQLVLV